MAQMVERVLGKDEVTGSIPVSSSKKTLVRMNKSFFSYIRLRRVILSFAQLYLLRKCYSLREFWGEYNITETVGFNITFTK